METLVLKKLLVLFYLFIAEYFGPATMQYIADMTFTISVDVDLPLSIWKEFVFKYYDQNLSIYTYMNYEE